MWKLPLLCSVCSSCSSFSVPALNLQSEVAVKAEKQTLLTVKKHHRYTLKTSCMSKVSQIPTASRRKMLPFLGCYVHAWFLQLLAAVTPTTEMKEAKCSQLVHWQVREIPPETTLIPQQLPATQSSNGLYFKCTTHPCGWKWL